MKWQLVMTLAIMWFSIFYNLYLERKIKSMKQGFKDIETEMSFECSYIEDKQLRDRILNILRVMILKHF